MQAGARVGRADPVGQDKRVGARLCLAPCLHNNFPVPIAPGRDAGFGVIFSIRSRSSWRHILFGESSDDG